MNREWLFFPGDIPTPISNRHLAAYMANKAGYAPGPARGNFDDSEWRKIGLPHDASIEGAYDPAHHVNSGFLPRRVSWYRRHFHVESSMKGRSLRLRFDGIATHATVYVNGHLLHRNFCGYTPFTIDFTDVAHYDAINTVAIRADATYMEGWWYEGEGIYRHVDLIDTARVHIAEDGFFVRPQQIDVDRWDADILISVSNATDMRTDAHLTVRLIDPSGREAGTAEGVCTLVPRSETNWNTSIRIDKPHRWSLESRSLYHARVEVRVDGQLIDDDVVRFGFRTIRFDADRGFFLNDQHVRLNGTCNHQDHGGLGVAVPESILRFRIRQLQKMGCNAYRCAHHPPSRQFLDLCDEMGLLVMDENRNFGTSPEHLRQLAAMVRRDRSHPSVILWSICNEESIQGTPQAAEIAKGMKAELLKYDPSRPVTAAMSGGILVENGMADVCDVLAFNYQLPLYDDFRARFPDKCIVAAETHCAQSTRGETKTDVAKHRFGGYDEDAAPWGATARTTWRALKDRPYVAGIFVWTGFDYRGEPSPHEWPSVMSHWGLLDLCGFEKDAAYLHRAWWTAEPFIHLLPPRDGQVKAYTNCSEAELIVDGRSIGRKAIDPIEMAEWDVPESFNEIEARAFSPFPGTPDEGRVPRAVAKGPLPAYRARGLNLTVHPSADADIFADGSCAVPITIAGASDRCVTITVEGEGRLIGLSSGDPTGHDHPKGGDVTLFHGLAQAIVQTTDVAGDIRIIARSADGEATLSLRSTPASPVPSVPAAKRRHLVSDWQMTRVTPDAPDIPTAIDVTDMNTFERIEPHPDGQPAWKSAVGYALYRANFKPPKRIQSQGGKLVFHGVRGSAEVFLDGRLVGQGTGEAMTIDLPAPAAPGVLFVRMSSASSGVVGLTGEVELV